MSMVILRFIFRIFKGPHPQLVGMTNRHDDIKRFNGVLSPESSQGSWNKLQISSRKLMSTRVPSLVTLPFIFSVRGNLLTCSTLLREMLNPATYMTKYSLRSLAILLGKLRSTECMHRVCENNFIIRRSRRLIAVFLRPRPGIPYKQPQTNQSEIKQIKIEIEIKLTSTEFPLLWFRIVSILFH